MEQIRWAVIGTGSISTLRTVPAITKEPGSVLAAVADTCEESAKKMGEQYGVPYFTDIDEMFTAVDFDVVYIATPLVYHYEQAMKALGYKKHVFLEKPMTMKSDEAEKLLEAFKSAGLLLYVNYMMKNHTLHNKAREIIKAGGIGKVADVRARFSTWNPDNNSWRQNKAISGGGAFMDLGVHLAELIEYVLDEEIADVKSFTGTHTFSYDVDDGTAVIFRTKSGTLGYIDASFNVSRAASESVFEIYGSLGGIICRDTIAQVDRGRMTYIYGTTEDHAKKLGISAEGRIEEYTPDGVDLYVGQISAINRIIKSDKLDYFYTERAVHVQKLVDKIYGDN